MDGVVVRRIVLGYDGSEHSEKALAMTADLARRYGASVVVVHAFPHFPRLAEPGPEDSREIHAARELAEAAVKSLREAGVETEPDVLEGPAAEAILNAADAHQADLIVVGSRGHGQFSGLLLGSQSDRVVHHATVPVLVAR